MDGERGMKRANRKDAMDRKREKEREKGQTEKHFSRLYAV